MNIEIKTIETERLILRKFEKKDEQNYIEYVIQPEGLIFSSAVKIPTEQEAKKWFKQNLRQYKAGNPRLLWAAELKAEGEVIGAVALENVSFVHDLCELGWRINKNYWNKGYTTEAADAIISYIFKTSNINRIEAINVHIENRASQKVCEKLGFKMEGIARQVRKKGDKFFDAINYSLLRQDYNANR